MVEEVNTQQAPASLEKALAKANNWIKQEPENSEAYQCLGLLLARQRNWQPAKQAFEAALRLDRNNPAYHTNLSNILAALGDFETAYQHLHVALRLRPLHAETYNNLGRLDYKQSLFEQAVVHFKKALRIDPDFWEAHYNLANSYASLNQMHQALAHYQAVVRLKPDHTHAHFNLGLTCVELEDYPQAEKHLTQSITLGYTDKEVYRQLGYVLVYLGQSDAARSAFVSAVSADPTLMDVHHNLAVLYLQQHDHEKALEHFRQALKLDPNNQTAQHMIASLTKAASDETPNDYVEQLFDQYADYYNKHLKQQLGYDVPGSLRNAVGRCLPANPKAGRVLDLGCGTGLCGVVFRDLAFELIGVDLSQNMINQAKTLDTYESLIQSDLNVYLEQTDLDPFDLMIAGDVLVYQGELTTLFKNIAQKLNPKGLFAFTIEHCKTEPFQLQTTGRFAHSKNYIVDCCAQHGLIPLIEETITLRKHEDSSITGLLYVVEKNPIE